MERYLAYRDLFAYYVVIKAPAGITLLRRMTRAMPPSDALYRWYAMASGMPPSRIVMSRKEAKRIRDATAAATT